MSPTIRAVGVASCGFFLAAALLAAAVENPREMKSAFAPIDLGPRHDVVDLTKKGDRANVRFDTRFWNKADDLVVKEAMNASAFAIMRFAERGQLFSPCAGDSERPGCNPIAHDFGNPAVAFEPFPVPLVEVPPIIKQATISEPPK